MKKLEIIRKRKGITLIALIITVILLVILAGTVISTLNSGNIFDNAISVVEQSKIASKKEEIELAIIGKMDASIRELTIDKIIETLEKKGIVDEGNSNSENGQVKTNPDGYIYEITEKPDGSWEVKYIGKGELDTTKVKLNVELSTTGITDKVTLTVTAKAKAGIKSITMPDGSTKTYTGTKTEVSETYEVSKNGEYTFTATTNKGDTDSKTITIDNIIEGTIEISAEPSEPTNKSVTVTIIWPSGSEKATKEISSNGGEKYTTVNGTKTTLTLNSNCVVKARIKNSVSEIKTATLNITNIDKLSPNTFTPSITTTSNSITVTGSTTDKPATETDGSSGIKGYYFSKDNGSTWQNNSTLTNNSYTYTGLTQGTEYTIKMKAVDKAGNETITESKTATTVNIASLGDIQISASTSDWTNQDVKVTVTWPSDTTGLTKKISTDGGNNWSDYTGEVSISSNCIIKAKLIDTSSQEGQTATLEITNIDKTPPTKPSVSLNGYTSGSWTSGNVVMSYSSTEDGSGIDHYEYSHDGVNVTNTTPNPWTISWDGQWNFYVRAVDKAGNSGEWSNVWTVRRDANAPTVSAKQSSLTITQGDSYAISNYFTTNANGSAPITNTAYSVSNTNSLGVGTHTVTCTVTKATGRTASASMTVVVNNAVPVTETYINLSEGVNYITIPNGVYVVKLTCYSEMGGEPPMTTQVQLRNVSNNKNWATGPVDEQPEDCYTAVSYVDNVYIRVTPGKTYALMLEDLYGSGYLAGRLTYSQGINQQTASVYDL